MLHFTEPRSAHGYQNRRSPGAFVSALLVNGGVAALLVSVSVVVVDPPIPVPPLPTHWVDLDPVPPEITPEPETPLPVSQAPTPPIPKSFVADTPIKFDAPAIDGTTILSALPSVELPRDAGTANLPVTVPVLIGAELDPRYADRFKPSYPSSLRRAEIEGQVRVRVTIDVRGRVVEVEELAASNPEFFRATRRHALRNWRFRPATRDGKPVQSQKILTLEFRLED